MILVRHWMTMALFSGLFLKTLYACNMSIATRIFMLRERFIVKT